MLPPWHVSSIAGGDVPDLAVFAGRPLLILLFALGGPGCRWRAIPFANRVVVEQGESVGVVGVHTTFEGEAVPDDEITRDLEALQVRFPVVRDAGLAATFHAYRAGGTPHWILVSPSGTVVDSIFGSDPNRALLRLDYHLMEMADRRVVGFGGGCHWCTEAVFQSLRGVDKVEQGWIRSSPPDDAWSEAVVVHFRPDEIDLETLIDVHLRTHSSASDHAMRDKYRSAVYSFDADQHRQAEQVLGALGEQGSEPLITRVLTFEGFRLNQEELLDYYTTRPEAPFCRTYIDPKLRALRHSHGALVKERTDVSPAAIRAQADLGALQEGALAWRTVIRFANHGNPPPPRRVEHPDAHWRSLLTDEQYRVTRQQHTEQAHSSPMCEQFEPGRYACVCCHTPLFDADTKFSSRSGWPSFSQPITSALVAYRKDASHAMTRIEAVCAVCDAHLGHVFPDGPAPSGLRFCINGAALEQIGMASDAR